MPELPDIAVFNRLVQRHCLHRVIAKAIVTDPASLEGATVATLQRRLKNQELSACSHRGKVLFVEFAAAATLAMHFGPNGSLQYVPRRQPAPRHVRLWLDFAEGDRLAYINPRRIGHVHLVRSTEAFIAKEQLGPDALDSAFDGAAFAAVLNGSRRAIKSVLMDQMRIAGIGNTYSDEILFQARLHPALRAGSLGGAATRRLFNVMKSVLETAIEHDAGAANFRDRLPRYWLLPERRDGGHCPRCGSAIRANKIGGRTAYFCPTCQPPEDKTD
jgi:formamidopyrimidine-DNA glycosylase